MNHEESVNREEEKIMPRKEVSFAVIGCAVGPMLAMAAGSFSPLEAQNQYDTKFGTKTCRKLEVADSAGNKGIWMISDERRGVSPRLAKTANLVRL